MVIGRYLKVCVKERMDGWPREVKCSGTLMKVNKLTFPRLAGGSARIGKVAIVASDIGRCVSLARHVDLADRQYIQRAEQQAAPHQ